MGRRKSHDIDCECILCLVVPLTKSDDEWRKLYKEAGELRRIKRAKSAAKKDVKKGLVRPIESFFIPTYDSKNNKSKGNKKN